MAKKIIILSAIVFVIILIYIRPFSKWRELHIKNRVLVEEIERLKGVNKGLEEETGRLEKDIGYVEKRAREKTGAVKKGEVIYKVIPPEE